MPNEIVKYEEMTLEEKYSLILADVLSYDLAQKECANFGEMLTEIVTETFGDDIRALEGIQAMTEYMAMDYEDNDVLFVIAAAMQSIWIYQGMLDRDYSEELAIEATKAPIKAMVSNMFKIVDLLDGGDKTAIKLIDNFNYIITNNKLEYEKL